MEEDENHNNNEDVLIETSYPSNLDPDFLYKTYKKVEFQSYRSSEPQFSADDPDALWAYRQNVCSGKNIRLQNHQAFLANFINPNTPYRGLILCHGTGSGKTCAAVAIAEQFRSQVEKYNTKIFVILPGPILKDQFWNELVSVCTNNAYVKSATSDGSSAKNQQIHSNKNAIRRRAIKMASKYYSVITYKNFHIRVLGEKMRSYANPLAKLAFAQQQRNQSPSKTNKKSKKKKVVIREEAVNKIETLDNTLIIVDEAHNFTNNEYGEALAKLMSRSQNTRLILMSATPMKNLPDEIVPLLNFIRPPNDPIIKNKVFTSEGTDGQGRHTMTFVPGGKEYLQQMATGYVSYFRGNDPYTFATRQDEGETPPGFLFVKITRCPMESFQEETYISATQKAEVDALDKNAVAAANFVFPGVGPQGKLRGFFGENEVNILVEQLKDNRILPHIQKEIKEVIPGIKNETTPVIQRTKANMITGSIFKLPYLKHFSSKFATCLQNILKMEGTVFVYSNLVYMGVRVFEQVLRANGFLEYNPSGKYNLQSNTLDWEMKTTYGKSSRARDDFLPATFISITGTLEDSNNSNTPQSEKLSIIKNVFNNPNNHTGKFIKVLIGSKVVNEGVTLENVTSVHILDFWYHLGRIDQVVGRAIRHCKHFAVMKDTPAPIVKVFKYVTSFKTSKEYTREELLWKKAESKYINIKKVERALMEVAVDCPVNYALNRRTEEIKTYKDCTPYKVKSDGTIQEGQCPQACQFRKCLFTCKGERLNLDYYDKDRLIYKQLSKEELDYSTLNDTVTNNEIRLAKETIKNAFRFRDYWSLAELKDRVRKQFQSENRQYFDEYYVHRALDQILLGNKNQTGSNLLNLEEYVHNQFNIEGYLVYDNETGNYVFKPITDTDMASMSVEKVLMGR